MAILMIDNKKRQILNKLISSDSFVSGTDLCKLTELSPKTMRNRMRDIHDLIKDHGAEVVSKTGNGYHLNIIDPTLYHPFRMEFLLDCQRNRYLDYSSNWRVHFIIRRLLVAKNPIPLETLEETFYISRGTLNKELRIVKTKLADFGIRVRNKKPNGIHLHASEWSIRLCMLYEHKVFVRLNQEEKSFEHEFDRYFNIEKSLYRTIESSVLKNLVDLSLPNAYLPKLVYYIVLSKKRGELQENIFLSNDMIRVGKYQKFFMNAKSIIDDLSVHMSFSFTENDAISLSMLLGSYLDLDNQLWSESEVIDKKELATHILKTVFEEIKVPQISDSILVDEVTSLILSSQFRSKCNVILDEEILHHLNNENIIIHDLTSLAIRLIEHQYSYSISKFEKNMLRYIFFLAFLRHSDDLNRKLNIAVISQAGHIVSTHMKMKFEQFYKKYIHEIVILSYQQFINQIPENTDAVFIDFKASNRLSSKIPLINIDMSHTDFHKSLREFYLMHKQITLDRFNTCTSLHFSEIRFNHDASFLEPLVIDAMKNIHKSDNTELDLNQLLRSTLIYHHEILLVRVHVNSEFVRMIQTNTPFHWKNYEIRKVVIYSYGQLHGTELLDFNKYLGMIVLEMQRCRNEFYNDIHSFFSLIKLNQFFHDF